MIGLVGGFGRAGGGDGARARGETGDLASLLSIIFAFGEILRSAEGDVGVGDIKRIQRENKTRSSDAVCAYTRDTQRIAM